LLNQISFSASLTKCPKNVLLGIIGVVLLSSYELNGLFVAHPTASEH